MEFFDSGCDMVWCRLFCKFLKWKTVAVGSCLSSGMAAD
jgi:hypothetical protein